MLRSAFCCRRPTAKKYDLLPLFEVAKWCPGAKKYDLLSLFVVSKWCPSAKKHELLPLFVVSDVVPQTEEVRFVVVHCGFGGVPPC